MIAWLRMWARDVMWRRKWKFVMGEWEIWTNSFNLLYTAHSKPQLGHSSEPVPSQIEFEITFNSPEIWLFRLVSVYLGLHFFSTGLSSLQLSTAPIPYIWLLYRYNILLCFSFPSRKHANRKWNRNAIFC